MYKSSLTQIFQKMPRFMDRKKNLISVVLNKFKQNKLSYQNMSLNEMFRFLMLDLVHDMENIHNKEIHSFLYHTLSLFQLNKYWFFRLIFDYYDQFSENLKKEMLDIFNNKDVLKKSYCSYELMKIKEDVELKNIKSMIQKDTLNVFSQNFISFPFNIFICKTLLSYFTNGNQNFDRSNPCFLAIIEYSNNFLGLDEETVYMILNWVLFEENINSFKKRETGIYENYLKFLKENIEIINKNEDKASSSQKSNNQNFLMKVARYHIIHERMNYFLDNYFFLENHFYSPDLFVKLSYIFFNERYFLIFNHLSF